MIQRLHIQLYTWVFLATSLLLPQMATASDQELYDPAPPADSAFVRLINITSEPVSATAGAISFNDVPAGSISAYQILKAGEYPLNVGEASHDVTVESGHYYSLALSAEGVTPLKDALMENPAMATVYFYNLSAAPKASLRAPGFNTDIIADLEAGKHAHKEMNALELDIAVQAGDITVETFEKVALKRRTGYSFLVTGEQDTLQGVMVENSVTRQAR